jgi:hypothetical protein
MPENWFSEMMLRDAQGLSGRERCAKRMQPTCA